MYILYFIINYFIFLAEIKIPTYTLKKYIYHPSKWTDSVTGLNGHYKILKFVGNETGAKLTTTRLGKEIAVKCCIVLRKTNKRKIKDYQIVFNTKSN